MRKGAGLGVGMSILAGMGLASYLTGRRAVPSWTGAVRLRGLADEVHITRDRWGVPALRARTERDLFFAQGYVHAADRLFQMDLLRRMASGRLSEIVGESTVGSDKLMRAFGFEQGAEQDLELCSDESRALLRAYADGVNRYISTSRRRLPIEFRILGYKPAPWRPHHSLLSWRLMAFGLCGNWEAELARAEIVERFGEAVLDLLDDELQHQVFPAAISIEVLGALRSALRDAAAPFGGGPGVGSNNWALGPRRTASGGAIIANDPHLELQLPSVWYENILRSDTGFEVRGFSIPGSPSIVLGHNGRVAWSFTNSCADVQDLYVEELSVDGSAYHDTDDTWRPLEHRRERIHVARSAPVDFDVRSTRRGPIVSDVLSVAAPTPISLRWFGVGPSPVVDTTLAMARAADVKEFREALRGWTAPSQNVVFADTAGNIAYQLAGSVPVRAGSDGSRPLRGSDPAGEWISEVAYEDLPHSLNPGVDRIVTANDRITPEDYPHFISREWMNGYRAARIRTLVDAGHRHTASDQLDIQADVHSIVADELLPLVVSSAPQPSTEQGRILLRQLEGWDRELGPSAPGARAWRAFHRALQLQVYGFLGDLTSTYLGYSRTGVNGFWSLFGRTTPRIIAAIAAGDEDLLELGARVGPTACGPAGWAPSRSWTELLGATLDRAGNELADSGTRRARTAHRMRLQHPLGVVPVLRAVANARVFDVPGDPDTVWQQSGFENPGNPYAMVGPSHRHVIDLANLDRSLAVLAGGQSGHPASPHYLDQLELWRSGSARPAPWSQAALEAIAQYHQVLQPA